MQCCIVNTLECLDEYTISRKNVFVNTFYKKIL